MIQELVYTSAPRGLQPGKSGFCTVACTQGMTPNLFMMLESMSGYRHLSMECAPSPTVYSYHPISLGGRVWQVLSRISAYGLDYTQRANKLADHWVLDPSESVGRNAARLLQPSLNLLRSEWNGDPRWLPNPTPLPVPSPHEEQEMKRCLHWKMVTGDEGWAGVLCDNAVSNRVTTIIVPPLFDILTLFEEALSLLPTMMRWQVSFSTYLTRLPPGVPCLWRSVVDGTPEADAARDGMYTSANLVDLCRSLPALSTTGLESSLYVQQARLSNAPRAKVVTPSPSLTNDADESFPPPDPSFIRMNAGPHEFSGPIMGVTNAPPFQPTSPLRDGVSSRLDLTPSLGGGYESVPERPNLAAAACSPEGYAASRQKIFGKVPELPAMARSKRRRENWIVGILLVGFLLGVGGGVWYWIRPPKDDTAQEPAKAAASNGPSEKSAVSEKSPKSEPAAENAKSQDQKNPEMLQAQKQEDVKLGDGASSTSDPELKDGSTDDARPKEDNSDSKGGDKDSDGSSTATSPTDQNITKASMASEGSDSREVKEKSSESVVEPAAENAESQDQKTPKPPQEPDKAPKSDNSVSSTATSQTETGPAGEITSEETNPNSEDGGTDSNGNGATTSSIGQNTIEASGSSDRPGPPVGQEAPVLGGESGSRAELEVRVTCPNADQAKAIKINPPSIELEEGSTLVCKLIKVIQPPENQDESQDGKPKPKVSSEEQLMKQADLSEVDFNIKNDDGRLYANQSFDYETMEKKEKIISLCGMSLRILVKDKKYSPEDSVELTFGKNVTINIPKSSALVRIEGDENEVFSEPVNAFPKLNVKSQGKKLTWNCREEWSSSDSIDITFECTNQAGTLDISSEKSHSFTFGEDGSIHMGKTVLRPMGFKTINLKVNGSKEDTITINGLIADTTTITSSSGNETVMFLQPNGEDKKTFELDGHHGEDPFGYHLTITGKKMTIVSSKATSSK